MNAQELEAALSLAEAKAEGDWQHLPEGKTMTLHVASNGVGLSVTKIKALRLAGTQVHTRNDKDDLCVVVATDVFACTVDAGGTRGRKAGFSP